MSFLFVDRILDLNEKVTRGIKWVTPHDPFLITHEGETVLLPSIIGETLGQLCAWNVMQQMNFTHRPVAGMVGDVKILGQAKVGDCIELTATIEALDSRTVHYHASAKVRGREIFSMRDSFGPLLPMEQFIQPALARNQFEQIHRPGTGEWPAPIQPRLTVPATTPTKIDGYDEWQSQSASEMVARKGISRQAPYFGDHFPRMPVYPMTLLLNANLQLLVAYLQENTPDSEPNHYPFVCLRKVKMSRFVHPGDCLETTLKVQSLEASRVVARMTSRVDGQRVAVSTIELCHRLGETA